MHLSFIGCIMIAKQNIKHNWRRQSITPFKEQEDKQLKLVLQKGKYI